MFQEGRSIMNVDKDSNIGEIPLRILYEFSTDGHPQMTFRVILPTKGIFENGRNLTSLADSGAISQKEPSSIMNTTVVVISIVDSTMTLNGQQNTFELQRTQCFGVRQ